MNSGPVLALLSAGLFGVSPALVKLIASEGPPVLLAGLLYFGSGIGLIIWAAFKKENFLNELQRLSSKHKIKLIGATVSGGVLAPIFLVYGIRWASAFEVSLLLNLESVMTTIIAACIFREYVGVRVWLGKLLLVGGGLLISLKTGDGIHFSLSAFFVVLACFFWGIDNNLTRDVDEISPITLASVKGLCAGIWNIFFSLFLRQGAVRMPDALWVLVIGAFSYGLSLVLFVRSLRLIGSSRTSTYFASGPFLGMIFSIAFLGEHPAASHWIAATIMFVGIGTLYRETHSHSHTHEPITHRHPHVHDDHHQHSHDGTEGPEPHLHTHTHEAITHNHAHWPDIHHRHSH